MYPLIRLGGIFFFIFFHCCSITMWGVRSDGLPFAWWKWWLVCHLHSWTLFFSCNNKLLIVFRTIHHNSFHAGRRRRQFYAIPSHLQFKSLWPIMFTTCMHIFHCIFFSVCRAIPHTQQLQLLLPISSFFSIMHLQQLSRLHYTTGVVIVMVNALKGKFF